MIRFVVCCAIACVCALPAKAERSAAFPRAEAHPAASDTLRYRVQAGDPLIVALPAQVDGREATYRLLDAPALSWLVDRSFLWRTTPGERGQLPVLIERRAEGVPPETVVLLVEIVQA